MNNFDEKLCLATLSIADDYGDGEGTMRCQLPFGHVGLHIERFKRERVISKQPQTQEVTITWTVDETCYLEDFEETTCEGFMGECRYCMRAKEDHEPRRSGSEQNVG